MTLKYKNPPHSFHIPVMGTGFTIDTPLKVAKYGISSVISLVDDILIEQMRKFYCEKANKPYEAIQDQDEDSRARRITAYLNLLNDLIIGQTNALRTSPFLQGSDITRYYEMLPSSPLKQLYLDMLATEDLTKKNEMQNKLRSRVISGSIDVNIMTKLDCNRYQTPELSDASSALRGYANSDLDSSIIFSAGFNPHLYGYIPEFKDFFPNENGALKKRIVLKVGDYRSAMIQGKYLAKRGLWVSEYRVESALNCGGHAFINDGYLLGPILEEFKEKRQELIETLHEYYEKALHEKRNTEIKKPHKTLITVQGGIGTHDEHQFLLERYNLDSAGWGTPFMLVPEATNLDDEHIQKLLSATQKDVFLSSSSPLGVPFWNLATSSSEEARRERIEAGEPGSPCPKHFAKLNTEFTKTPICIASRAYQKLKLLSLSKEKWSAKQLKALVDDVLSKACLCNDLAGSATKKYGIDPEAKTAVCAGPNIINFKKIATLEEMVNHIYGRISLIKNSNRPHVFIKELMIHVEYLKSEMEKSIQGLSARAQEKLEQTKANLNKGIEYYQDLAKTLMAEQRETFIKNLNTLRDILNSMGHEYALA
jgi:hypothetical protein